jgi:cytochrome P450
MKAISDLPSHPEPITLVPDSSKIYEVFEQLANQYGNLFVVPFANQPLLVISDSGVISFVLRKKPDLFGPYQRKNKILEIIRLDGIEAADDSEWKQQREAMASALDSGMLAQYMENIKPVIESCKSRWISHGKTLSELDLEQEMFALSSAIFKAILFGDISELPIDQEAINTLYNLVAILSKRIDAMLPEMHLNDFSKNKISDNEIKSIFDLIEKIHLHNRDIFFGSNNGAPNATNMLQALLKAAHNKNLEAHEIKLIENILLIAMAAEPTTASALIKVLLFVAENPSVQKEIQQEVDTMLDDRSIVDSMEDLKKLKCIESVVNETLRISSVSHMIIREAKEDLLLEEVLVPRGTPLILLIGRCSVEEENFRQASEFKHHRWYNEYKAEFEPHNNKAFLAFGAGPRSCPGRILSMVVIKSVLATIFRCFTVEPRTFSQSESDNELNPKRYCFNIRA